MLYRLLAVLSFLILGATQALAADCIIVGGEFSYRIPDCIENSPTTAVQKFLGSNYAIITDRKDGKILAVFLAEIGSKSEIVSGAKNDEELYNFSDPILPARNEIVFNNALSVKKFSESFSEFEAGIANFTMIIGQQEITIERQDDEDVNTAVQRGLASFAELIRKYLEEIINQGLGKEDDEMIDILTESQGALNSGEIKIKRVAVKDDTIISEDLLSRHGAVILK